MHLIFGPPTNSLRRSSALSRLLSAVDDRLRHFSAFRGDAGNVTLGGQLADSIDAEASAPRQWPPACFRGDLRELGAQ